MQGHVSGCLGELELSCLKLGGSGT